MPDHIENGWIIDGRKDLEHSRKYLDLFSGKIAYAKKKPGVDELYRTFRDAFPQAGRFGAVTAMF